MKRIFTLLLFIVFWGGSAIAYDFSAVCSTGQTLYYNITSDTVPYTVEVTYQASNYIYYYTYPTGDLVIPESIVYNNVTYSVTSITSCAFYNCSELTSVTIPNSVTSIGANAFYDCSNIANVSLSSAVTNIGASAFYNCNQITSITIPNAVTSIGNEAFSNCTGLTTVNFNATNCTTMGSSSYPVFKNSNANATINIGEGVTTIPDYAFYGLKGSGTLTIPNSVTSIGNRAFSGCSGLTSVTIPNSVESIGNNAFYQCSGLTGELTIPNSVTSIGGGAFSGCSGLTSVTIPTSVTSIGGSAFYNCSGLTSVTIPNSVTSIGGDAFSGCSGLTSPVYNANCFAYFPCGYATTYTIPNGIQQIVGGAFRSCSGLTSVTIGNSVISIGNDAFYNCSGLTSITIPNSVTSIGNDAFYNCSGLTSITIPNSVTSIGNDAFYNCSGLTAVYFTGGVDEWCGLSFENNIANPLCNAHNLYVNNELVTDLVIPSTVTTIKNYAFYSATCLTSVTIPSSVTSIGRCAFSNSSGLTSVYCTGDVVQWCRITFGNSEANPLYYAHNLYIDGNIVSDLVIPDTITEIKDYTFNGAVCLTSLTIPNCVTSIGNYAFSGCDGLTKITIGESVTSIGICAFPVCSELTLINYNAISCSAIANAFTMHAEPIGTPVYSENFDSYSGAQGWWANNNSYCTTPVGWYVYTNSSVRAAPHITTSGNPYSSPNALSFCNDQTGNTSYAVMPLTSNVGIVTFYANYEATDRGTLSLGYVKSSQSNVSSFVEIQVIPSTTTMTYRQYAYYIPNDAYIAFRWDYSGSSYYAAAIDDIKVYNNIAGNSFDITLNIGENVVSIPDLAFNGILGLSSVNFNAANYTGVIVNSLFDADNTISKITIGENVTTIPNNAFRYCTSLDSIISSASNPPALYGESFDSGVSQLTPVLVPCGTVANYERYWTYFRNIQQSASCPVPYTITVLTSNPNYGVVTGGGEYLENTTAILTATPYEECMFVNWNDGNTDNPREITVIEDATYIATFVRGNINPTIYTAISDTACGSYIWNDITYTESGEYEQIFTASSSADSIVTLHLTILPLPEPVIIVDGILDACNPETTSVTLSTGEYDSYMWSNGDSAESTIVTTPGSYYVEAVDSLGCHGFSEEVTIGYSTILTEAPQIKNAGMSDNGFNVIGWRVSQTEGIASFEIYREDNASDVFSLIAVVTRSSARTYIDSTANPSARAYRYKICAVDACGGMSPMSEPHKTMHLTINQGVGNDWNLIWSHYEGLDIRSYKIYRGTTKANMVVIGEVPSSQNTFTDSSNPYNIGFFYKIAIVKSTRSDDEEMLTSNIVDNGYIVTHNVIVASSNTAYGSASGSGVYAEGTEVVIEATANAGYEFSAWNDGSTENPRSVTITSDTLFIANFVALQQTPIYTITVYSSNQAYGTVSGGGTYAEGTEITLTATANSGYEFVSWSDGSLENPRTITVIEDAVYIATFAEASSVANYTITVISSNPTQGSVTGGGSYPEGSVISVEAIANDGYQFVSWSDNCTDNPRSITVASDAMYIATFIPMTDISETSTLEISAFPNPTTDILNITSSEEISSVEIVNVMGQIVLNADVNSDNVACNVNGLTAGVYIVRIYGTDTALVICQQKFIKE